MNLIIENMACGGCAKGVTATIRRVDPDAEVEIDIASKAVSVKSDTDTEKILAALTEAGFPPRQLA
ncbi:heavy-metal-associated domain-containing protein [Pelagibacterium limicola]|uniref:heavy-metal-associated domain-containing protein n=1 Tax=Pelagibacterium limicola TaxID=2791022 RepID=UPI0018AFEB05|nr:heavy-metal-associated domain-containing protein [Pelagibacterium limicola]